MKPAFFLVALSDGPRMNYARKIRGYSVDTEIAKDAPRMAPHGPWYAHRNQDGLWFVTHGPSGRHAITGRTLHGALVKLGGVNEAEALKTFAELPPVASLLLVPKGKQWHEVAP